VHLPGGWTILVVIAVLSSVVGVVLETSFGRSTSCCDRADGPDLLAVVRRPTKAFQMFGGSVLVLLSYVLALGFSLTAFHAHARGSTSPRCTWAAAPSRLRGADPGKVGAVEAALIAGLTGVGIASGPAVAVSSRFAWHVLDTDHSRLPAFVPDPT